MTDFSYYGSTVQTSLSSGVTSGDTDLPLDDGATYPDPAAPGNGPYKCIIGWQTAREEIVLVTAKPTANTLRVTRGYEGSSATSKNAGDVVIHGFTHGDAQRLNDSVPLSGGTMTGALVLSGAPTTGLHAATKTYVDTGDAAALPKAGGTMTGALTLSGAPASDLHAATKKYVDDSAPVGVVFMFPNGAPSSMWHPCDGTAHGSAALLAYLGSANAPDYRDLFFVCAGIATPLGSTGGAASVTLTAAQSGLPAHTHTTTVGNQSADHTHSVNPPSTTTSATDPSITVHGGAGVNTGEETGAEAAGSGVTYITDGTADGAGGSPITADQGSHTHTVDIASFTSGTQSANHNHSVTVNANTAAAAASAHENRPPYAALMAYIKKA